MKKAKVELGLEELLIKLASNKRSISLTGGYKHAAKDNWTCEVETYRATHEKHWRGARPLIAARRAWHAIQKEENNVKS